MYQSCTTKDKYIQLKSIKAVNKNMITYLHWFRTAHDQSLKPFSNTYFIKHFCVFSAHIELGMSYQYKVPKFKCQFNAHCDL